MKRTDALHLNKICLDTMYELRKKYKRGCKEHGGNLRSKPVIDFMSDELMDHICYFNVLRGQWRSMIKIIDAARIAKSELSESLSEEVLTEAMNQVYNILTVGNPEGVRVVGD